MRSRLLPLTSLNLLIFSKTIFAKKRCPKYVKELFIKCSSSYSECYTKPILQNCRRIKCLRKLSFVGRIDPMPLSRSPFLHLLKDNSNTITEFLLNREDFVFSQLGKDLLTFFIQKLKRLELQNITIFQEPTCINSELDYFKLCHLRSLNLKFDIMNEITKDSKELDIILARLSHFTRLERVRLEGDLYVSQLLAYLEKKD
mgnify:CR=1 FL=1